MGKVGGSAARCPARRFQDLIVWQRSHELVLAIYAMCSSFPFIERFGLTAQIRRAAVSIPANIAEGFRRRGRSEKARYFNIAQASLEEVRYFLILAQDLEYAAAGPELGKVDEVSRLLDAYVNRLLAPGS